MPDRLSVRQLEIVPLIAEGLSNDEIAARLGIESGTVANHVAEIKLRLHVRKRIQVAVWAVEHGLYRSGGPEDVATGCG